MKNQLKKLIGLLYKAYKIKPFIAIMWFVLPIISGIMLILIARAQIDLINNVTKLVINTSEFNLNTLLIPAGVLAAASIISVMVSAYKNTINTNFIERITLMLQTEIIEHTLEMPMEYFDSAEYADKLQRARNASQENLSAIFNNLMYILQYLINLISIMVILSAGHWLLSVLTLLVTAILLFVRVKIEIEIRTLNRELTFQGRMADYLKAEIVKPETMKELRVFDSIGYLLDKWHKVAREQNKARAKLREKEIKTGILLCILSSFSIVAAVYILILGIRKGSVTAGLVAITFQKFIEALSLAFRLSFPISKLYLLSSKFKDILEYLLIEIPCKEYSPKEIKLCGKIDFHKVSFTYPSATGVQLKDISFSIKPGETIALVGDNGAGKSTLVGLLLGLYKPKEGSITWGEQDYSDIKPELLYKHISVVFQDFEHYQLSLHENLLLSNEVSIKETELYKVLEECGISELADKEKGLNSMLGRLHQGGKELSGGQWQRLSIARAMLKKSDLIILDEPNSALDPQAELELFKQFKKLTKGKSSVFVSHRLGWARYADRILVLDGGELIEIGSHEELIQKGGKYAETFKLQASWYI
jgi:ATP-binding cassette subfamily B protein